MKKLFIASSLFCAMFSFSAQADDKVDDIFKTYRFGLFVGPTFNSLRPTSSIVESYNISKGKGNVGFSFGINADYNINDRYTIFSGIGMDWRGGQIIAAHDTTPIKTDYLKRADVSYRHQYLTIPLGLKMKATEFDKFKIFAQTGFDLGLLLSNRGSYITTTAANVNAVGDKTKLKDIASGVPVNLGWHIGPGVEYDLNGKNAFYLSVLYRNGFIDATSPQTNATGKKFKDGNVRSNSFAIRVGYFF
jgi:hypothetical protein